MEGGGHGIGVCVGAPSSENKLAMVKAGGPGRGEHLLGELRPGERTLPGPWGTKTLLGKFLGLFTLPSPVAGFPGLVWMVLLSLCLDFSHFPGCLQSPHCRPLTPVKFRAGTGQEGITSLLDAGTSPPGETALLAS